MLIVVQPLTIAGTSPVILHSALRGLMATAFVLLDFSSEGTSET